MNVSATQNFGFASTTDLAHHWQVDRRTVPTILSKFGIARSTLHKSPRYRWADILLKVDRVPHELVAAEGKKFLRPLMTTSEVADALDVSTQTVRNYVAADRLKAISLLERTPRFLPEMCGL